MPYAFCEQIGKEIRDISDEIPFEIPESWEWCRLSDLAIKEIKRGKSPVYADSGSALVFAQKCNVKTGRINITLAKYLADSVISKYPQEEYMQDRDIIVNSTGTGTLGRIGLYSDRDNPNNLPLVPDSHVTIVRVCKSISQYIYYILKWYQPYLEESGEGSTKQKELKAEMYEGEVSALPYLLGEDTGCDFCACKDICGFDQRIEGCEYRQLQKYSLEEAVECMKEKLGIKKSQK